MPSLLLTYDMRRGLDCRHACNTRISLIEDGTLQLYEGNSMSDSLTLSNSVSLSAALQDSLRARIHAARFFELPAQLPVEMLGFSGATKRLDVTDGKQRHTVVLLPDALTDPDKGIPEPAGTLFDEIERLLLPLLGYSPLSPVVDLDTH